MTFSKHIFAMVMMPMQANRKQQLKLIEQFEEILSRYEDEVDRKVLAPYYIDFEDQDKSNLLIRENVHPKWYDRKLMYVMKKL